MVDVVHQLAKEMVGLTKEVSFMNHNLAVLTAKVSEMERKPGKHWESAVMAVIAAIAGAVAAGFF